MEWRKYKYNWLFIGLASLVILLGKPVYGQDKGNISGKDLEEVVNLLEDPQKREAFVKDLKTLIETKEAAVKEKAGARPPEKKARKLLFIENLFVRFESLSRRAIDSVASTAALAARTPEGFGKARVFFSQPENQSRLLRLVGTTAGSILIAFIVGLLIGKHVPKLTDRMRSLASRIAIGFERLLLNLIPYGILLISPFVLFNAFPSFPLAHSLILFFFAVLFFYRLALEVFSLLLSPLDGRTRILPLSDENANYHWVWILRYANYTAFYFVVTKGLMIVEITPEVYYLIRTLLLIGFPIMISVFIMQVAREIRVRHERSQKSQENPGEGSEKVMTPVIRYWPILAIAYSWAIFLFQIIHFERGFRYLFMATLGTAITILAILIAHRVLNWLFKKFFAVNEMVRKRFPGLEEKTNRYIQIIRRILSIIVVIIGLGVVAQIWGIPVSAFVASKTGSLIIIRLIAIFVTLGVVVAIMESSQFLSEYFLKEKKGKKKNEISQKRKTLVPVVNTAVKIAAGFIGGIVILDQLGVNTTPILAGAGIVGLAVGFGSQTLVKDLINGLFILFEESIRVGDYADLGKNQGIVEAVGLRKVKLRDLHGNVHVVPNSSIDTLTNMSKEFSRTVIDVGVAYKEDVDEVMEIMKEVGEEMRNDPEIGKSILEPIEIFGLQSFADSALIIRARLTTKPLKQWGLKREFNRRIKKVFDERGIEIPFPHRTIYMGEPKKGPAPPMYVQLNEG